MANIFTSQHFQMMPWKNGGGSTLELIKIPDPLQSDSFLLRLSIAYIQTDGPFSLFPGIDRCLMLLQGDGFDLNFTEGQEVTMNAPFVPFYFQGEKSIECKLVQGACYDFNVMVKRDWAAIHVRCYQLKKNDHYDRFSKPECYVYLTQTTPLLIHIERQETFQYLIAEDCWVIETEIHPKRE